MNISSVRNIALILVIVALFAYAAVSPRTLPLTDYNEQFYENLRIAFLSTLAPVCYIISVFDAKENDINAVISTFFHSFVFGYAVFILPETQGTTPEELAAEMVRRNSQSIVYQPNDDDENTGAIDEEWRRAMEQLMREEQDEMQAGTFDYGFQPIGAESQAVKF